MGFDCVIVGQLLLFVIKEALFISKSGTCHLQNGTLIQRKQHFAFVEVLLPHFAQQTLHVKGCLFPMCSLTYAKVVQTECNTRQACLTLLLRCSLTYAKLQKKLVSV